MTPEQFAYWLQGFLELSGAESLDARQVQVVRDHLALVFEKRTPDRPPEPVLPPDIRQVLERIQHVRDEEESGPAPAAPAPVPLFVPSTPAPFVRPPALEVTCAHETRFC